MSRYRVLDTMKVDGRDDVLVVLEIIEHSGPGHSHRWLMTPDGLSRWKITGIVFGEPSQSANAVAAGLQGSSPIEPGLELIGAPSPP